MLSLTNTLKRQIIKNAQLCHELHQRVHKTFSKKHKGTLQYLQWQEACRVFHKEYSTLAFPGGEIDIFSRLAKNDLYTIEAAICFLEVRPYFFRSGYLYQKLMRKLKHVALTESQQKRYQIIRERYQDWKIARAKK